ncbi:DUF6894 family protein [Bradyrhizobium sp. GCM10027635]|uniref:DUF6894 family protein n=1 Tax=Bradyrhizobium sp. GCM10027635 TaxID=3273384 RepID=UPI00364230B0
MLMSARVQRDTAVTRYYFDIRDDTGLYPDEEGLEFVTQREAEMEAAHALADLARDLAVADERRDVSVEVRTDAKRVFQAALIVSGSNIKQ